MRSARRPQGWAGESPTAGGDDRAPATRRRHGRLRASQRRGGRSAATPPRRSRERHPQSPGSKRWPGRPCGPWGRRSRGAVSPLRPPREPPAVPASPPGLRPAARPAATGALGGSQRRSPHPAPRPRVPAAAYLAGRLQPPPSARSPVPVPVPAAGAAPARPAGQEGGRAPRSGADPSLSLSLSPRCRPWRGLRAGLSFPCGERAVPPPPPTSPELGTAGGARVAGAERPRGPGRGVPRHRLRAPRSPMSARPGAAPPEATNARSPRPRRPAGPRTRLRDGQPLARAAQRARPPCRRPPRPPPLRTRAPRWRGAGWTWP